MLADQSRWGRCRALGDANFKEGTGDALVSNRPDVRHLLLTPQDSAIVIASDGMFDVLSDQEAADFVSAVLTEEVAETLSLTLSVQAGTFREPTLVLSGGMVDEEHGPCREAWPQKRTRQLVALWRPPCRPGRLTTSLPWWSCWTGVRRHLGHRDSGTDQQRCTV